MSEQQELKIENLHVRVEDQEILKGIDLTVEPGKVHAIMGPNGGGKSTLAYTLMGHPGYEVTEGRILLDGTDITEMAPDERAKAGLFLAFQESFDSSVSVCTDPSSECSKRNAMHRVYFFCHCVTIDVK